MRSVEVFSDLKFEKDDDYVTVKADSQFVIIELSDEKLIRNFNKSVNNEKFLYDTAIKIHKAAKSAGIRIFVKTPVKQLFSLGNTRFYSLRLILLKVARLFRIGL